jgi:transposase-like protein
MSELYKKSKDFTKEERVNLLEQFHASGLEFQQFAAEHNLNPSTLKNWIWLQSRPEGAKKKQYEPTPILRTEDFVLNTRKTRSPNEKVHDRI